MAAKQDAIELVVGLSTTPSGRVRVDVRPYYGGSRSLFTAYAPSVKSAMRAVAEAAIDIVECAGVEKQEWQEWTAKEREKAHEAETVAMGDGQ